MTTLNSVAYATIEDSDVRLVFSARTLDLVKLDEPSIIACMKKPATEIPGLVEIKPDGFVEGQPESPPYLYRYNPDITNNIEETMDSKLVWINIMIGLTIFIGCIIFLRLLGAFWNLSFTYPF